MRPDRTTTSSEGYKQEWKSFHVDVSASMTGIEVEVVRSGKLAWITLKSGAKEIRLIEDDWKTSAKKDIDNLIKGLKQAKKFIS
jgi:Holliday junction resolvase RusA-like endonuclease